MYKENLWNTDERFPSTYVEAVSLTKNVWYRQEIKIV